MWKLLCGNDLSLRVELLLIKTTDSNLFFPSLVPIQTDVVPMWVAKTCLNNIPNCADREIIPQLGQHFCFVRQPLLQSSSAMQEQTTIKTSAIVSPCGVTLRTFFSFNTESCIEQVPKIVAESRSISKERDTGFASLHR